MKTPDRNDSIQRLLFKICSNQGGPEIAMLDDEEQVLLRKILANQAAAIAAGGVDDAAQQVQIDALIAGLADEVSARESADTVLTNADLAFSSADTALSNRISSAQTVTTTGNIDDLAVTARIVRMNNASLATIRGIAAGTEGQRVTFVAIGAGQVNFNHQDTNDATASSRLINMATSAATSLSPVSGAMAEYEYDASTQRWRLIAHEQGAWITRAHTAGDFTGNGSMTWTVEAADLLGLKYMLRGKTLHVSLAVATSTVGGTPNTTLQALIPGGFQAASQHQGAASVLDNNVIMPSARWFTTTTNTLLSIRNGPTAVNWAASTNLTTVFLSATFEVV